MKHDGKDVYQLLKPHGEFNSKLMDRIRVAAEATSHFGLNDL